MMSGLSDDLLAKIALSVIAGFLALFGMTPSEGGLEFADHGPHRVFTVQSKVPPGQEIDPDEMFQALVNYLERHNATTVAVRFQPYNVEAYVCPCGCGTFLYVSVYHD